jgi:hypothetical protein
MQNLTNHTAEVDRGVANALLAGSDSGSPLQSRGGIHNTHGGELAVTQNGSPNMSVNVASGVAFIPGVEGSKQGVYTAVNDATVNVTLTASDPAQPRIDLIVAQVRDQAYSGAINDWRIINVTGVASASPAVPSAPNSSLILARIAVAAATTTIVNANITDQRVWAAALGGVINCTSTTRPGTNTVPQGQLIYELDTTLHRRLVSTTWFLIAPYKQDQTLVAPASTITFSNIPATLKRLRIGWTVRGDASSSGALLARINADAGANYRHQTLNAFATTVSATAGIGQTSWAVGNFPSGAGAGDWAGGNMDLFGWDAPHATYLTAIAQSGYVFNTSGGSQAFTQVLAYLGSSGSGYTSFSLLQTAGNFQAGCSFYLEGWD